MKDLKSYYDVISNNEFLGLYFPNFSFYTFRPYNRDVTVVNIKYMDGQESEVIVSALEECRAKNSTALLRLLSRRVKRSCFDMIEKHLGCVIR